MGERGCTMLFLEDNDNNVILIHLIERNHIGIIHQVTVYFLTLAQ